ncbi:hypothetical protein BZA77DRAFT_385724 [Pyronema omphalodes]|nr:hypothetical protein BZA77DRAFT_385724 [Pyronema omphalodes]
MRVSYPFALVVVSFVTPATARVLLFPSPTPTSTDPTTIPHPTPEITPAPIPIYYEDILRRRAPSPATKQDDPTSKCAVSCGNGYCCPSDTVCSLPKDGPPQCLPKLSKRQTSYDYQAALEAQISSIMSSAMYDANNQLSYYTNLYNINLNNYLSTYCSCTYNQRNPYISSILSSFSQAYLSPQTRSTSRNNYTASPRKTSYPTSNATNSQKPPSTTAIVVVSVVGAAVLIIIGLLIWWCCKKCACCNKRGQRNKKNKDPPAIVVPVEGKALGAAAASMTGGVFSPTNNNYPQGGNNTGLRGGDIQRNQQGLLPNRTLSTVSNDTSMSVGVAPALPAVAHGPMVQPIPNVIPSPGTGAIAHRNSAPVLGGVNYQQQQHQHQLRNQQSLGTVPEMQANDRVQDWRNGVGMGIPVMPGVPEAPGDMVQVQRHNSGGPPAYQQVADIQQIQHAQQPMQPQQPMQVQELEGWGVNPASANQMQQQQNNRGYWQRGAVPVSGSYHEMGPGRSER